jgi:hypothetical protein
MHGYELKNNKQEPLQFVIIINQTHICLLMDWKKHRLLIKSYMQLKNLSKQEKAMIAFVLILMLAIGLSWSRISKGIKKGFEPYYKDKPAVIK